LKKLITKYNTAGIEVKPDFPGGIEKFYKSLVTTIKPEEGLKGKVYVTFVVEKDGSLTDIKVLRYWLRYWKRSYPSFEKCPNGPWMQNGKTG
jgi:protein TonB